MRRRVNISDIWVERTTPMVAEVISAMAEDIKINGLQQPLIIDHRGMLIDGLLRLRAVQALGKKNVEVDVAQTLEEALELLKKIQFNPKHVSMRRRRDLAECLDALISEHIKTNLSYRAKGPLRTSPTRDLVGKVLGYPWHRIRRVYRWLEEDTHDPARQELLAALDAGTITANKIFRSLAKQREGSSSSVQAMAHRQLLTGDIKNPREQLHLMEELNRQLSGTLKGAHRLGSPISINLKEFNSLLNELTKHRAALSKFINTLRREVSPK